MPRVMRWHTSGTDGISFVSISYLFTNNHITYNKQTKYYCCYCCVTIISNLSQRCLLLLLLLFINSMLRFLSRVHTPLRARVLTRHITRPQTTDTKPHANENRSFVAGLFNGQLHTDQLFPYPDTLSADQLETLRLYVDPTDRFFKEEFNSAKYDEQAFVDPQIMDQAKRQGAFGLQIPERYNGLGLNNTQYCRMTEIMGRHDLGFGIVLGAHQSIGFKGILLYGNEEQKEKYLPKLATGEQIAAYCLTEPASGSDAFSIKSRAELSPDGKSYILNGGKIWISNGGLADIFTVFAKTPVKDKNGIKKDKISAFIVEKDFGGVTHGQPEKKMGIRCSNTAEVHFDNVKVPVENRLLAEGDGFKVAMNILNNGRFGMAGALSGTMRMLIERTVEHVRTRKQFGDYLSNFGVIQEKIANMTLRHYVTESMAYQLCGVMDSGVTEFQLEAAISKVFGSESAWMVADEAIQIHGGMGFMQECGLERVLRDLRIFRIFEGSNEILRLFVSLTGLQLAGGRMKGLEVALKSPLSHASTLLNFIGGRVGIHEVSASHLLGSRDTMADPLLGDCVEQLVRCVNQFGVAVERLLMLHGREVIHQQIKLRKLSEAAIDTYGMAAVVARASNAVRTRDPSWQHQVLLATSWCQEAHERVLWHLRGLRESDTLNLDRNKMKIAEDVVSQGGPKATHPLGF